MNKTFLTLSLILTIQAHAQPSDTQACTSTAKYICSTTSTAKSPPSLSPEYIEKVKTKTFPDVKNALVKKVASLPIDEKTRNQMLEKIKNIKFNGSDCSALAAGLNNSLVPQGFYTNSNNSYTICKASTSDFALVTSIAYELSRSIDPCAIGEIAKYPKNATVDQAQKQYPIKGLLTCLGSEKSVSARTPASEADFKEDGFCADNQIPDAFADWITGDVVIEAMSQTQPNLTSQQWREGLADSYRDQCGADGFETRIDGLLASNPRMRKAIGCNEPNKYIYCDANNPDQMANLISAPAAAASSSSKGKATPSNAKEGAN